MPDETPAPVDVDALRALLDDFERGPLDVSRQRAAGIALQREAVNALPALLAAYAERDMLIYSRDAFWQNHGAIAAERDTARKRVGQAELERDAARAAWDRAISVAVALHNENAVYEKTAGPFMKRLAEEAGAHSGPDPWVDVETLRAALADAEHQLRRIRALAPLEGMERELRGPNDHSDAQIIAYHGAERCREALAATDPARAER